MCNGDHAEEIDFNNQLVSCNCSPTLHEITFLELFFFVRAALQSLLSTHATSATFLGMRTEDNIKLATT
jgi:hypothetical protein